MENRPCGSATTPIIVPLIGDANQPSPLPKFFADKSTGGQLYEFYLSDEIDSAEKYVNWFNIIRHASLNDVVKVYINSPGGNLDTTLQFMKVLAESQAQTIGIIEGICASGATMIFLTCAYHEVTPYASFMIHNYSGMFAGKGGEMADRMAFEQRWAIDIFKSIYRDFLADKELESVLRGTDIWLGCDEVIARVNRRNKAALLRHQKTEKAKKKTVKPE